MNECVSKLIDVLYYVYTSEKSANFNVYYFYYNPTYQRFYINSLIQYQSCNLQKNFALTPGVAESISISTSSSLSSSR